MELNHKYRSSVPEYLGMFSNSGDVVIKVKFTDKRDKSRSVASFRTEWHELMKLFHPDSGEPYVSMYFDEYRCIISKIEIDPTKKVVVISVGYTGLPSK
jgi:hypothetical protein